uniref:Uncharacterized protein n=1 Tax=Plectus sambesii TaxID=2011161 RepID=A0A914WU94_9BILA
MNGSTAVKRSTMVVRVGSNAADLEELQKTVGSTEIIVNRSLSTNVSVQTFASGATAIEIKDYFGSKPEIHDDDALHEDRCAPQRLVQVAVVGRNRFVGCRQLSSNPLRVRFRLNCAFFTPRHECWLMLASATPIFDDSPTFDWKAREMLPSISIWQHCGNRFLVVVFNPTGLCSWPSARRQFFCALSSRFVRKNSRPACSVPTLAGGCLAKCGAWLAGRSFARRSSIAARPIVDASTVFGAMSRRVACWSGRSGLTAPIRWRYCADIRLFALPFAPLFGIARVCCMCRVVVVDRASRCEVFLTADGVGCRQGGRRFDKNSAERTKRETGGSCRCCWGRFFSLLACGVRNRKWTERGGAGGGGSDGLEARWISGESLPGAFILRATPWRVVQGRAHTRAKQLRRGFTSRC